MPKTAIYPGTFDPVTNGHVDLVRRSCVIFDRVIVSIAPSPRKGPLFGIEERIAMMREATKDIRGVEVEAFQGLLVEHVIAKGANAIIRGLRAVSDFEYELQMALMNRRLSDEVETVFMMPSEEYSFLTSSVIKEVAGYGGNVDGLVPPNVAKLLREKFGR
jgi:pantetheine-phosphate adenylyltransferase